MIRLVLEVLREDPSLSMNRAVIRIGQRVGVNPDTLRGWVKQARINSGEASGVTTSESARIKALEAENRELKRANEILLAAASFLRSGSVSRDCRGSGLHRRTQGPIRAHTDL